MEISKLIKIARLLFIAQKINDIKPYVKLDLIARQYGKKLKQGKLEQYEKIMQQKYPEKFKKYQELVAVTLGNISIIVNSYLQKNSQQTLWFYHQYIKQEKHIQDILNIDGSQNVNGSLNKILRYLSIYQKYDKTIKKQLRQGLKNSNGWFLIRPQFDVAINGNYSFENLVSVMQKKQQKNKVQSKKFFDAPKSIPQVQIPGVTDYKVYKAMGNNKKHFKQLHDIDGIGPKKQNASTPYDQYQSYYASWCIVCGSVQWGTYLQSPWNYYYYITKSDNTPYVLMNFGTDSNAQIKNVSDLSFSNYDQQMVKIIDYLSEKDNFDPERGSSDYKAFVKIKKIKNNKVNIDDLYYINDQSNLQAYEDNSNSTYIYQKNGQQRIPKYLIVSDSILKLQNNDTFSNKDLIYLLDKIKKHKIIYNFLDKGIISKQTGQLYQLSISMLLKHSPDLIFDLIDENKVQFSDDFVVDLLQGKQESSIVLFINKGILTNKKIIDQISKKILNQKDLNYLAYRLLRNKNLPMKYYNKAMKIIVEEEKDAYSCLENKLYTEQWKDKLVVAACKNRQYNIDKCIDNGYVTENSVNGLIKIMIRGKIQSTDKYLYFLSNFDNITDNNVISMALYLSKGVLLSVLLQSKEIKQKYLDVMYDYAKRKNNLKILGSFAQNDKQKNQDTQNIVDSAIQKKNYNLICNLFLSDKITDQNKKRKAIQTLIRANKYNYLKNMFTQKKELFPEDLLLKSIKLFLNKCNNMENYLTWFFRHSIIPVQYGKMFLKYAQNKGISYLIVDEQWNKKYFTLQFVKQLLNFKMEYSLDYAIKEDKISKNFIPTIMEIAWKKQNYKEIILKNCFKNYNSAYHLPYRQKIFEWLYQNHYQFLMNNFREVQTKFKPFVLRKLMKQNDDDIAQFVIKNSYQINGKLSNEIYQKFKNTSYFKILPRVFKKLNEQNKLDLIKRVFQSNDKNIIKQFFDCQYNYQYSQQENNAVINLINKMSIQDLLNNKLVYHDKNIDQAVINKVINQTNSAKQLCDFYLPERWSLFSEAQEKMDNKLIQLCKNSAQLKQALQSLKSQSKYLFRLLSILFDYNNDLFVPMVADIDQYYIDFYLKQVIDNGINFKRVINSLQKSNNNGQYDDLLGKDSKN